MDAITTITAAIAAGALAALKSTASSAVSDSYSALKDYLKRKYASSLPSVSQLEQNPASKARREVLAEDLTGAERDSDLLRLARKLIEALGEGHSEIGPIVGVEIRDIKAALIELNEITVSGGAGVRIERADVEGAISIRGVDAKRQESPKN